MNTLKELNIQIENQKKVVKMDEINLTQINREFLLGDETFKSLSHYETKLNISKSILESLLIIQKNFS